MITLAVTAYRESQRENGNWIRRCVSVASHHPFVGEILVYDDGSEDFDLLKEWLAGTPKLRLLHGAKNVGVFGAKYASVANATYDWVQLCDSDNFMDSAYFDGLAQVVSDPSVWYCPSFARPKFDYRHLCGEWTLNDIPALTRKKLFACFINTGNQCVPRDSFISTFAYYARGGRLDKQQRCYFGDRQTDDLKWRLIYDAADSIFLNKTWLLYGNALHVLKGLEYDHHWTLGTDSSWVRAPEEKYVLPLVYCQELRDALMDKPARYEVVHWTSGNRRVVTLINQHGEEVRIDGDTLQQL